MSNTTIDASLYLAVMGIPPYKPPTRQQARERLAGLPLQGECIPTINRLRDLYGIALEYEFWDRIGMQTRSQPASVLVPMRINPLTVLASQAHVNAGAVTDLLRLSKQRLIELSSQADEPIIVVSSPHGLVSVNGHHRLRALQLLDIRKLRAYRLPDDSPLNKPIRWLFERFDYAA